MPLAIFVLAVFIASSCLQSELAWANITNNPQPLRQLTGLPSLAVGNLSPATRNPGLETCTSFYDVPGGFCSYYAPGAPDESASFFFRNIQGESKP
jgi:hypothetical protein